MRRYLLPENGNFYKSNLHCHSTCSDGMRSPAQLKEIYKKMGYSVLAITDHDILLPHDELNDDEFITLHGFEVEIGENIEGVHPSKHKCCHICAIALDEDNIVQPCWNEKYTWGNAYNLRHLVKVNKDEPEFAREYTGERISLMMETMRKSGFFVTYNHPNWSRERYTEYMSYHSMHAVEMFNGGCILEGYEDYSFRVYEDLLSRGEPIYCIGTDDNHNWHGENTPYWDSGIAFTMIKASELKYKAITNALLNGDFYASEGPQIYNLWIEDEKIHIECSPAMRIDCMWEGRAAQPVMSSDENGITSADFEYKPYAGWFRITLKDKHGKHACTNAYFPDAE